MSLEDTVSIVTGGGRGIGRAVALSLAEAGSTVAVISRSESELAETVALIEANGGQAAAWSVDVTDGARVETVVAEIERDLGPISVLVNNAGNGGGTGPLWMTDTEEWWRVVEVNVRGPYLFTRAVLPRMVERKSGRIVNVASNVGINATPFAVAYSCSKAALLRLTDSLAGEVGGLNIQVFAMSPGFVWTTMTERAVEEMERFIPDFEGIPEAAVSPPERAGELIVRLARGDADDLSGRYLHVEDDLDEVLRNAREVVREDALTLRLRQWDGPAPDAK